MQGGPRVSPFAVAKKYRLHNPAESRNPVARTAASLTKVKRKHYYIHRNHTSFNKTKLKHFFLNVSTVTIHADLSVPTAL